MDRLLLWLSRNVSVHIYDLGEEDPSVDYDHYNASNGHTNSNRRSNQTTVRTITHSSLLHTDPTPTGIELPALPIPTTTFPSSNPSHRTEPRRRRSSSSNPPFSVLPSRSNPPSNLPPSSTLPDLLYDNVLSSSHLTPALPTSPIYSLDYYELQYEQQRQQMIENEIGEPVNNPIDTLSTHPPSLPPLRTPSFIDVPLSAVPTTQSPVSPLASTTTNLLSSSSSSSSSSTTRSIPRIDRNLRLSKVQRVQLFLLYKTCAVVGPCLATLTWIFQIGVTGRIMVPSTVTIPATIRNILNIVLTIILFWSLVLGYLEHYIDHQFFRSTIASTDKSTLFAPSFHYRFPIIVSILLGCGYISADILSFYVVNGYDAKDNQHTNILGYTYLSILMTIYILWLFTHLLRIYRYSYSIYTDTNESTIMHPFDLSTSAFSSVSRSPTASSSYPIRYNKLNENSRKFFFTILLAEIMGLIGNLLLLSNTLPYYSLRYWYAVGLVPPISSASESDSALPFYTPLHILLQCLILLAYIQLTVGSFVRFIANITYLPNLPSAVETREVPMPTTTTMTFAS